MTPRSYPIPYKLITIFAILGISIGIVGYIYYTEQKKHLIKEKQAELSAIADLKVSQIVNWRRERIGDAMFIFENRMVSRNVKEFLENPDAPEINKEIAGLLQSFVGHQQYADIILVDKHGDVRLSVSGEHRRLESHMKAITIDAMQTQKMIFADLHKSELSDEIHLSIFIPILSSKASVTRDVGAILLLINPHEFLYQLIQSWPTPSSSAETLLVRREEDEVVFLNDLRHKKNTALSLRLPLTAKHLPAAMAVLGQEGIVEGFDYRNVPVIAAIRAIPDSPWFFVAKIDREEVYAPIHKRAWFVTIIVSISILAAGLSVIIWWRQQRVMHYRRQYEAEEAQRRSEQKYRSLFENMLNGFAYCKMLFENGRPMDLIYLDVNSAFERLTGLKNVVGRKVTEVIPGIREADPELFDIYGNVALTGMPESFEIYVRALNIWFSITVYSPQKEYFVAVFDVITERKLAEEVLRKREEEYRLLFESNPLPMWVYDFETLSFLAVNETAIRHYGYSREEFLSMTIRDIHPPETLTDLVSTVRNVTGELREVGVWRQIKKDGTIIDVEITTHDLIFGGRKARLVLANDVTQHRKLEQALKKSERQYRTLVDNALVGVYRSTIEGRFLYVNEAMAKMFECASPEEMLSEHILIRYRNPEDREVLIENLKKYGRVGNYEIEVPTKAGKLISIIISATIEGDIISGIVVDITEQKKLQEQLRQSQKMEAIGQIAGGVAHDFNNILTAIIGYAGMAQMKMKEDDPFRHNIEQILSSAEKAANLTQNLLAFSRKQIINTIPVSLNELVKKIEKFLLRVIGEDIELKAILASGDLTVMADAGQLEQVIMNLATNARDAMPKGGILTIETEEVEMDEEYVKAHGYGKPGSYALVSVTDSGTGMDEKTRERIFDPFFTTKELGRGTGLGLSIVYGIIKQHNGVINCYSEIGKGTTFKIYLPLTGLEAKKEKPAEHIIPAGGTETILLAEDEEDVRKLSKTVLEEFGYKVIEASDGADAVNKFMENKDKVQLLLLDVIMPKLNGKEAYVRIKEIKPGVKVLFASGYPADFIHKEEIIGKRLEFVSKPVSPTALLKKIREVLDKTE